MAAVYDSLSAAACYGLRKVISSYVGSAVNIRRSSDNAIQDIGFDSSGNFDTTSFSSFIGAGSGFVTKWYDQSGNGNDVAQATAANQPQLILNETAAGKAGVVFSGSQWLASSVTFSNSQPLTFQAFVNRTSGFSNFQGILSLGGTIVMFYRSAQGVFSIDDLSNSGTIAEPTFHSLAGILNGGSSVVDVDTVKFTGSGGANTVSSVKLFVGAYDATPTLPLTGVICECAYFPVQVSAASVAAVAISQSQYYYGSKVPGNLVYGGDGMLNGSGTAGTGPWSSDDGSFTMTVNSGTDPFGGSTAVNLKEGNTTAVHNIQTIENDVLAVANSIITYQAYLKVGTGGSARNIDMELTDASSTNVIDVLFDPSTGHVLATFTSFPTNPAGKLLSFGSESVGSGWYRCWLSGSVGGGYVGLRPHLGLNNGSTTSGTVTYAGDGTSNVNVWGPSIRLGPAPQSPILDGYIGGLQ